MRQRYRWFSEEYFQYLVDTPEGNRRRVIWGIIGMIIGSLVFLINSYSPIGPAWLLAGGVLPVAAGFALLFVPFTGM